MGSEYELKYRADGEALTSVRTTFPARWQKIPMETTYYDTADGALGKRHITLRRRLENGISVCTLTTPAPGGARGEWDTQKPSIEEAYVELCKLGGTKTFLELVKASNLKSPFEDGCLKGVVKNMMHELNKIDDKAL